MMAPLDDARQSLRCNRFGRRDNWRVGTDGAGFNDRPYLTPDTDRSRRLPKRPALAQRGALNRIETGFDLDPVLRNLRLA
jgi:hypothetical protein